MDAAVTAESQASKSAGTLLFVDDEANILSSLKRIFRPLQYHVLTANSGQEGLEILKGEEVDLIISDMRMPEMDGAEFLEKAAELSPDTARILLTGYADIDSTIAAINKGNIFKYISKPWEENDLKLTVSIALERKELLELTKKQNIQLKDLNANLEKKVEQRTEELRKTMAALEKSNESLKKSYSSSIKIFSSLLEIRAEGLAGHSRRVADQARSLATQMHMSNSELQDIIFASLLHDIGKIGLSDELIKTSYDRLKPVDRIAVEKHAVLGEGILMALEPLQGAARLIRFHHECFDGTGYPDRVKGNNIPLGARILSVVSDYDALLSGTLLRGRLSPESAQKYIIDNRGKRYDPQVVDAFFVLINDKNYTAYKPKGYPIKAQNLIEGMVLAKDVVTNDGVLLLAEGHELNSQLIDRIRKFETSLGEEIVIYVTNSKE